MGASAENFSKGESDKIDRLRRFSGLFTRSVRGAENDAGHERKEKPPVRPSDSDNTRTECAENESADGKMVLLSWNMTVTLISSDLVSRLFSMLCRIFPCFSLVTFSSRAHSSSMVVPLTNSRPLNILQRISRVIFRERPPTLKFSIWAKKSFLCGKLRTIQGARVSPAEIHPTADKLICMFIYGDANRAITAQKISGTNRNAMRETGGRHLRKRRIVTASRRGAIYCSAVVKTFRSKIDAKVCSNSFALL